MDSYTEAESEMSVKSRSFWHSVNDQVRKRQKQSSKDATKDSDKHSVIWRMIMSCTLQASVFMEKNYSEILHSIKNTGKDLTMKQMFGISEKLITEQSDEIYGVKTINGKILHGNIYLWLVVKKSSVSRTQRFTFFSDSVLCLGRMHQNPQSNTFWEDKLMSFRSSSEYRILDVIGGEPMDFEWNIFPGFTTLQLVREVQEFLSKMRIQPEDFTGRIIFMSMFNDILHRQELVTDV